MAFDLTGLFKKTGGFLADNAGTLLGGALDIYGAQQANKAVQGAATQAAQAGQYRPQNIFSPFGNVLSSGGTTSFQAPSDPYSVLPPEMRAASGEFADVLGGQGDVFNQLGAGFLGSLGSFDPRQAAQEQYDIMSEISRPWETRASNRLQDQLFRRGQLGTTGGGIQQEAFLNSQRDADLRRQLAARDYAGSEQNRLANLGTGFANVGAERFGERFGMTGDLLSASQSMFQPLQGLGNLALGYGAPNVAAPELVAGAGAGTRELWDQYGEIAKPIIGGITSRVNNMFRPVAGGENYSYG